ncbi:MAG TPA: SRPBCC domain-containing protein, partial [Kofleriaceae bacterium]|nr:SRPBCC domain-containing protein [Kofleriaceae bacterium]
MTIAAPLEDVWRAFVDPDWITGWMAERAGGRVVTGGTLELAWDSLGMAVELEVVAAEPPARLVLRAHPPGRPPQTQTAALARDGGATRVELIHGGFPPGARGDDEREGTRAGWHTQLRVLAHYLARHPGAARACAASVAPVTASWGAVDRLLRAPDGLARWLTAAPARLG